MAIIEKKRVTAERLKEMFLYDFDLGIFTRLTDTKRSKAGDMVGNLSGAGYQQFSIDGRMYQSHRLAWLYVYGEYPSLDIDHINGIKTDNRIANLRLATESQNGFNVGIRSDNKSGFKGVHKDSKSGKWVAEAKIHGKKFRLGRFGDAEDAANAYKVFASKAHGDFYSGDRA